MLNARKIENCNCYFSDLCTKKKKNTDLCLAKKELFYSLSMFEKTTDLYENSVNTDLVVKTESSNRKSFANLKFKATHIQGRIP